MAALGVVGGALRSVPDAVLHSPLMQQGGFRVVEGLLDTGSLAALRREAAALAPAAQEQVLARTQADEWRGGSPARRFLSASGGAVQDGFYHAPGLIGLLTRLAGLPVVPTGPRGTYSYYARPGDFLALHRDIETCDLTVITCLQDRAPVGAEGGVLRLYPGRNAEPLSAIRSAPAVGAYPVRLAPGTTLLFFGGVIAHELSPVRSGQQRIVSVLCFRCLAGARPAAWI